MHPTTSCPGGDELQRFLLGRVVGRAADTLEEHLAGCPTCASRLAGLEAEDDLVAAMRQRSPILAAVDADRLFDRLTAPGRHDFLDPPAAADEPVPTA